MTQSVQIGARAQEARAPGLNDPPVERRVVGLHAPSLGRARMGAPGGWIVEAYLGYRIWTWSMDAGRMTLRSAFATDPDDTDFTTGVTRAVAWPKDGPLEARCLCAWHMGETPFGHTCGIYAYSRPTFQGPGSADALIHGEVYLWGPEVHVHERGIVGQFAMPAAVYTSPRMTYRQRTAAAIAALQYDVPLVTA